MPSQAVAVGPRPAGGIAPLAAPTRTLEAERAVTAPVVPNFQEQTVISGLTQPTVVEFAQDGRVFVAEKSGLIKVWDDLDDNSASTYADLRTNVHDYWDRGLLGMALDPDFTENGRMYVAYTYNAPIGGSAPDWPDGDCPNPPGGTTDGCVVSGRLSVLTEDGDDEDVLINDWCSQFPSHSLSDIVIDAEGALIVNGGDGANFNEADWGQFGGTSGSPVQRNPCGDPPGGVGGSMTLPAAEGGALRSQDVRGTAHGDLTGLGGSVIRINRFTGAPMADNPRTTGSPNERRIVAHGLRNPYRFALHPVNGDVWLGDVGWNTTEEINRVNPDGGSVVNFGWPCREGTQAVAGYSGASLCQSMSSSTAPVFTYSHSASTTPGDGCNFSGGSSVTGLAFYAGGPYPDIYDNALFFADYWRQCIWVMRQGAGGVPDPAQVSHFANAGTPVHLTVGPGGDLFFVTFASGTVRRIVYLFDNSAPSASVEADPVAGMGPLEVDFDASASSDPDEDALTYAWDFDDDDGAFDDAFGATPSHTYTEDGTYRARVRVSDGRGGTDEAEIQVDVGNTPPVAAITGPATSFRWSVGQNVTLSGTGLDPDEGPLPASDMAWEVMIAHCPNACHVHPLGTFNGVSTKTITAPDHEYPSHLLVRLTVTDEHGATDTVERTIQSKTVNLRFESTPPGVSLTAGSHTAFAPFTRTVISGSTMHVTAPAGVTVDGFPYTWTSWSDGRARSHSITANASATYTARFDGGYQDVPPGAKFRADIAWLTTERITFGCDDSPPLFCPNGLVTRGQMATFLVRALDLPSTSTDYFTDDETNKHEARINSLRAAGITFGCSATRFCPDGLVTRGQMASFLVRAYDLPATGKDWFTDDETNKHEARINSLRSAAITFGCGPTTFCPNGIVTRGQMAAFLHRAD